MTDEQINRRIAESCGWTKLHQDWGFEGDYWIGTNPTEPDWEERIPDYCNDLNAMHEAEKHIPHELGWAYAATLSELVGKLRGEIRVLQQRLRDANRGAEANSHVAWNLSRENAKLKAERDEFWELSLNLAEELKRCAALLYPNKEARK